MARMSDDELLTAEEVAELLRVTEHTLYRWRKENKHLPFYEIGSPDKPIIRYRYSEVMAFLGAGRHDKK